MSSSTALPEFSIVNSVIQNGLTVEASAGSGKTYSVAGVVALLLAKQSDLRISEILVTTFTRNAAAELRDRIRRQLLGLEKSLRNNSIADDDTLAKALNDEHRLLYAERLDRAVRDFDTATISTIHSVCSRVMAMAGLPVVGEGRSEADNVDLIENVVNSVIISYVAEHGASQIADVKQFAGRLVKVVREALSSPRSSLSVQGDIDESHDEESDDFAKLTRSLVRKSVRRVSDLTRSSPTFNDLLLRTADVLGPNGDQAVADAFRTRFKIAIIDEAQDTDQLQWEIFRAAFDANESARKLVTVGDPKQAIYRFRGADVEAYLSHRDPTKVQTLTRNWRSDSRLIKALNAVFDGDKFGDDISYLPVSAREGAPETCIGDVASLTILKIGSATRNEKVATPAARRVVHLLNTITINDGGKSRPLRPQDVCVLVTSRANGRKIESALRRLDVPAVSSGTESVMVSVMASDLRRLLRAMAKPGDDSAVRLAAATVFIGANLVDVGSISDEDLEKYSQQISEWALVLRRKGINGFAHEIRQLSDVLERLVKGRDGERRETDFAHLVELLHAETGGTGCTPEKAIEAFDRLITVEATAETVSRRVESDRDAVQIMTVHSSKGLEFPVVVVADLWRTTQSGGSQPAPVFHRKDEKNSRQRTIDAGWVVAKPDTAGETIRKTEELGEKWRLFYVAMTRAKHHVTLLYADGNQAITSDLINKKAVTEVNDGLCIEVSEYNPSLSVVPATVKQGRTGELRTASSTRVINTAYQRLSFSGLTKHQRGQAISPVANPESIGGGSGDDDEIITIRSGYSDESIPVGVSAMPMGRIRGGTYFGTVMHKVYELIDFAAAPLRPEVERVVNEVVVGSLASEKNDIVDGVLLSLETPLGGLLGATRLCDISREDRLDELGFEMGLANREAKVSVAEIGTVVKEALTKAGRPDDELMDYLTGIEGSFNSQLVGLMNGSIDALLRVRKGAEEKFFITDYKTNRLDRDGVDTMISGYSRDSMLAEMEHHDYPLQALIYGVSVYRFLRWARPDIDADNAIAGFAYFFVRGMVGEETPSNGEHRHGVFTWQAPDGLWSTLSKLFSRVAVAS